MLNEWRFSASYVLNTGVPQESNLGPLLLNGSVNDLVNSVQPSEVLQFSDNVKHYEEVHAPADC